jgi:hypothetical protein
MKRTLLTVGIVAMLGFGGAADAHAQMQWTDSGFVNVSLGAQAPSRDLTATTSPEIYGEPASIASTQDVGGGMFFDISGGYKVWRNLAVGLGYTYVGSDADATVVAAIPDPLFFDRPRIVTATAPGLKHSQPALNFTGTWMMPVTDKIDLGFQFGPTIFFASQELAGAPDIVEPTPTVNFDRAIKVDKTTAGVHFGVDATYLVTPRFGAGLLIRYTVGSADFTDSDDSVTLGGFQIGVGVRARF